MATKAEIILSAVDKTKAAFSSAKKGLGDLEASSAGLAGRFGTVGLALAAAIEGVDYKNIIDGADQISKLSQRTGIAVEQLTALKYAGGLSDVAVEDLGKGIQKLNVNMADAAGGGKETAAVFKAIGVQVKTADGALRNSDDVLGDIADRLATFKDSPEKGALAQALFGKGGDKFIPLLNSGKQGLADMAQEARELGVVFGDDLAKQAEAFNDNLTRLKTGLEGGKVAILGSFLPALNRLLTELVEGRKVFGSYTGSVLNQTFQDYGAGAATAREDIERLNKELERFKGNQAAVAENAGGAAFLGPRQRATGSSAATEANLAAAAKRLEYFKRLQAAEALEAGKGIVDERRFQTGGQTAAPIVDKNQAERDALARKQLDGRLKQLQDSLAAERDQYSFQDQYLQRVYADGVISLDDFYGEKEKAQQAFLADQRKGFDAEIAALRAYQAQTSKPEEKADADNKIADVLSRRAAVEREAGQAAVIAAGDRTRANEQLRKSVADLEAQLAELNGDAYTAALIKINQQTEANRKTLTQAGQGDQRAAEIDIALKNQALLNKLRADYTIVSERAQIAEESYMLAAQQSGASRAEVEAKVKSLRSASLEDLDQLIASVQKLNEASKDPELLVYLEQLKLSRDKAFAQIDPQLVRLKETSQEAGSIIANTFEEAAFNGGKLSDVIKQIALQLARLAYNEAVTKSASSSFANLIAQFFGGSTTPSGAAEGGDVGLAYAKGDVFSRDTLHKFANGSAFSNKVFSSPTYFKFRNGSGFSKGVMGEAGDEAVMPLTRGSDGKLGVYAQGTRAGGGGNQAPIVNIHNNGEPASAQVSTSNDSQGRLTIDVVLDAVANDIRRGGKVSSAGQSVHGWRRNSPRRG